MSGLVAIVAAYLLGSVPFSQLVARWRRPGVDLRRVGSGTVSGTGLYRVAGFGPLVLGGGLDVAKGSVAASFGHGSAALGALVAAAVVAGHCWSVFLHGAGGRGVSTAMGALAVLAWPGALVLLAGLAVGRIAGQTGLGVLAADVATVVVLGTRSPSGVVLGLAVVLPMLAKRMAGNAPADSTRTYAWRLLYDADPPRPGLAGLDGPTLAAALRLFAERLEDHRDALNRANVFPVPDGDTGTNLVGTARTIVEHLPPDGDWTALTEGVSRGALLGGRGSSGIILAQSLRVLVRSLPEYADGDSLARALGAAARSARAAVADPAEGTVLTVASDAARGAEAAASSSGRLVDVAAAAAAEARRSVARTPDLLPALKEAGVLDAGGLGYVLLLDAIAEVVTGVPAQPLDVPVGVGPPQEIPHPSSGGQFEVVCLLEASDERAAWLREQWRAVGDTVAVAGGDGTFRCHVHTDDIGRAIALAEQAGTVDDVEVTDLAEQVDRLRLEGAGTPEAGCLWSP